MDSSPAFDPFWMFRLPLSGAVNQRITAPWFSPSLTVNYAGDPAVEDRVVTEVASYGTQLGWGLEQTWGSCHTRHSRSTGGVKRNFGCSSRKKASSRPSSTAQRTCSN